MEMINQSFWKGIKLKTVILCGLSLVLYSCKGQVDSGNDTGKRLVSEASVEGEYKDPLFFIEGQLCQHLREIFHDSKGNIWLGTNVYDLLVYNGDSLSYFTEEDGFSGGRVTGILEDEMGNVWVATSAGLNKYDGRSFTRYSDKEGLANAEIWTLFIDAEGIIWLGTNTGLSSFDGSTFKNINVPKPSVKNPNTIYSPDRITAIAKDNQGSLWLGTDGYGICRYDGEEFVSFTSDDGLADNTISELLIDASGDLWIGSFWGGLCKYDGQRFINYTQNGDISGVEISALFEDRNGAIWIAVENNGVFTYHDGSFKHYAHKSFLGASILSIYQDPKANFWFGGWGGLLRYIEDKFVPVTKDGPWN